MEENVENEDGVFEGLRAGPGEKLRAARESKGLTLNQVGAETRIPLRHLETIEAGKFANLPGRTYAIGFSRTYAKLVGLDADEIVEQVRDELGVAQADHYEGPTSAYEPGDPSRAPTSGLVWLSLAAAALLLAGGYMFYSSFLSPSADLPAQVAGNGGEEVGAEGGQQATANIDASGAVVFTALENGSWIKFYDRNGNQLMQKEMSKGERYTVPADADGPQAWTGRPYAFSITIGGQAVPKLSEEDKVMKDVPVTAQALLDRANQQAAEPDAG